MVIVIKFYKEKIMEQCPACNAKYIGDQICHRCKMDLGPLLAIEAEASSHLEQAMEAFAENNFEQMFYHATRSCALRQTPKSSRVLACAAVLVGRFDQALGQWYFLK
jgi:hypothetical protein